MEKKFSRVIFLKYIYEKPEMGLFEAFLRSFGSSSILRQNLSGYPKRVDFKTLKKEEQKYLKRQFYNLTYELRKDGILSEKEKLTREGRGYFMHLREKYMSPLPHLYEIKRDPSVTILVTYDIPEKMRKKRAWFRAVLKRLDYEMLHQSAWIGQTRIPKDLLEDLRKINLLPYIHIVTISQLGSLKVM